MKTRAFEFGNCAAGSPTWASRKPNLDVVTHSNMKYWVFANTAYPAVFPENQACHTGALHRIQVGLSFFVDRLDESMYSLINLVNPGIHILITFLFYNIHALPYSHLRETIESIDYESQLHSITKEDDFILKNYLIHLILDRYVQ